MVSAMADRVLRGSRMGAVSYETDRDHDLAPRQMAKYRTPNGEVFEVPFADDAEIPEEWMSVSYTHLTLPTTLHECRSRWSRYH